MYDVLVVGAGAAGMMCCVTSARAGARTAVIEQNARPGRKLGITGKGRCNLTNNCDIQTVMKNVPLNPRFLYSALNGFSPSDTMSFFEELGVPLKTERGGRVFPVSDKAADIVAAFTREMKRLDIKPIRGKCADLIINDNVCQGAVVGNEKIKSSAVVVATGGMSYPLTGSDGSGYALAAKAGHTINAPTPSLVPMQTAEKWVSRAAGLNLRNISIKITDSQNGKEIYRDFGELIFEHYGVRGPVILSASAHIPEMQSGRYSLVIDLKPALSEKQLDLRILRDFGENKGRTLPQSLTKLLPVQLIPVITELSGISPEKHVDDITANERRSLLSQLKSLTLHIDGFRPIEEAIITRGGVSVKEINPKTMRSNLCEGLYFAGEIIDCDGYTGGFNLQIAFSTAYAAGMAACGKL